MACLHLLRHAGLAVVLGDSADLVGEAVDILFNARDRRLSVDIMELSKVVVETKFVTPRATLSATPALADSPAAPGALATSAVVVKQELVQTPVSGVVVKVEGGATSPSSASLMMPVMYPPRPVLASTTSSCGFKSPLIPNDGQKRIGAYTLEERKVRISKYLAKKSRRVWRKKIKYDCRKKLADNRPRIKGRFVKREEEEELEEHGAALQDDEELMTGLLSFDELLG